MRAHALSNTRKLNRHWQSGKRGTGIWWSVGTLGGEEYTFAPLYRLPVACPDQIEVAGTSYDASMRLRGIFCDTTKLVNTGTGHYYDADGNEHTTNITYYFIQNVELTPSFGVIQDSLDKQFGLHFVKGKRKYVKNCDLDDVENLLTPVYDFGFVYYHNIYNRTYNPYTSYDMMIEDIKSIYQNLPTGLQDVILPVGFVPILNEIPLTPEYLRQIGDIHRPTPDPETTSDFFEMAISLNSIIHGTVLTASRFFPAAMTPKETFNDFYRFGQPGVTKRNFRGISTSQGTFSFGQAWYNGVCGDGSSQLHTAGDIILKGAVPACNNLAPVSYISGVGDVSNVNFYGTGGLASYYSDSNKTVFDETQPAITRNLYPLYQYGGSVHPFNVTNPMVVRVGSGLWDPFDYIIYFTVLKEIKARKVKLNG